MPNEIVTPQSIATNDHQFTDANGTTKDAIATGAASGSVVRHLIATSTDSAARKAKLYIKRSGGSSRQLGIVNIPAEAGTKSDASVPAVNLLDTTQIPGLQVDADGNAFLQLANADELEINLDANCTAAKVVDVTEQQEDY